MSVVVIPDFEDKSIDSLVRNATRLKEMGKRYIADPVLDPLPSAFQDPYTASLSTGAVFRKTRC